MEVTIPEPARQQLLDLAADLVGRLPADEVPSGLRAVARFAAAKRKRLGAVALRATLDTDEDFRAKVAEAIVIASPALADGVAAGTTAASDPIDVIVVAYLTRPDGWAELIEKETARWSADRAGGADEDAVRGLREEVARLRASARTEPARTKQAVAEAVSALEATLAEVRRTVRDRTRELRAAERDRDAAAAARDEVQRRFDAQAAAHEAELRRLRTRLADVERTAESVRRDVRSERDLDEARLWLLTETLVQAAGGLRRELALSPPTTAPAESVAAATGSTAPRTATDATALDRLLALPNVHLIVDGYNVTKTGYGEQALADQRTRLIGQLAGLAGRAAVEITVAFDGARRPTVQPATPRGVRVLFSQDEIADDLIRRLVAAEPSGRPLVVVTSDQQIVTDVTRAGAWTAPSAVLLAVLG